MIVLVKGYLPMEGSNFAERLAERLNSKPPEWHFTADMRRAWEEMLQGWEEADTSAFQERAINVDHVVALSVFEHRSEYPPPPAWSAATPRAAFDRWRDAACLDALNKRLPDIFRRLCGLVESVEHPVVTGSELGTTPQDSLLSRMLLFKYSRASYLKILLRDRLYDEPQARGPTASVLGQDLPPEHLLEMIQKSSDGGVTLAPELDPSKKLQIV